MNTKQPIHKKVTRLVLKKFIYATAISICVCSCVQTSPKDKETQFNKRIDGFEKICAYYESLPPFTVERYEMIDPVVQVADETAVLSYNLVSYVGDVAFRENCTEVYRQQPDKQWKIIHSHFSATKPTNEKE